jgi:hypothetical protein
MTKQEGKFTEIMKKANKTMQKITNYNELISKEILKIAADDFTVRIFFTDNTYADIIGSNWGGEVYLCEYTGDPEKLIDPFTYYGVHSQNK